MTPAGTSNELDVQNGWEENTHMVRTKCGLTQAHFTFFPNVIFFFSSVLPLWCGATRTGPFPISHQKRVSHPSRSRSKSKSPPSVHFEPPVKSLPIFWRGMSAAGSASQARGQSARTSTAYLTLLAVLILQPASHGKRDRCVI